MRVATRVELRDAGDTDGSFRFVVPVQNHAEPEIAIQGERMVRHSSQRGADRYPAVHAAPH